MDDGTGTGPARIVIVRSPRRKRSAAAYDRGDHVEVRVPQGLARAVEEDLVARLVARVRRPARGHAGEASLETRAARLSALYLDGRARPASVRFVDNMHTRWGSATPATGEIRIARSLAAMPPWVLDYVLVHELAHLVAPGHGAAFWRLVRRYPRTERARGYLMAMARPRPT